MRHFRFAVLYTVLALILAGCAAAPRVDYTPAKDGTARVAGFSNVRVWADDKKSVVAAVRSDKMLGATGKTLSMLALSGGGSEGAYGAGFLKCWSKSGTRPRFTVVTGTSVGALIAPFAFLGSDYDPVIQRMFTSGETSNLIRFAGLAGLFGSGVAQVEPLRRLVDHYVNRSLLDAVAAQYKKGRRLIVVTTDLDSQRTALWDMGKIASYPGPQAVDLFRSVLLASASIPGVFPPEMIPVAANGHVYEEMHVDGSVTANLLVLPEALLTSPTAGRSNATVNLYAIVNGKIAPDFEVSKRDIVHIFSRAYETALKVNTRTSLVATSEYAKQHGWSLYWTAISPDTPTSSPIAFDTGEMRNLFRTGCQQASKPSRWSH